MSRRNPKNTKSLKENNPFVLNNKESSEMSISSELSESTKPSDLKINILGESQQSNFSIIDGPLKDSTNLLQKPPGSPKKNISASPLRNGGRIVIEEKPTQGSAKGWDELAQSAEKSGVNIDNLGAVDEKEKEYENQFPALGEEPAADQPKHDFSREILSPQNIVRSQIHHDMELSSATPKTDKSIQDKVQPMDFEELKQSREEEAFLDKLNEEKPAESLSTNIGSASIIYADTEILKGGLDNPKNILDSIILATATSLGAEEKSSEKKEEEIQEHHYERKAIEDPVLEEKIEAYENEFPALGEEPAIVIHPVQEAEHEINVQEMLKPSVIIETAKVEVAPVDIVETIESHIIKREEKEEEQEYSDDYEEEGDSDSNQSRELRELKTENKIEEYEMLFPPLGAKADDSHDEIHFSTHILDKEVLTSTIHNEDVKPIDVIHEIAHIEPDLHGHSNKEFKVKDAQLLVDLCGEAFIPTVQEERKPIQAPRIPLEEENNVVGYLYTRSTSGHIKNDPIIEKQYIPNIQLEQTEKIVGYVYTRSASGNIKNDPIIEMPILPLEQAEDVIRYVYIKSANGQIRQQAILRMATREASDLQPIEEDIEIQESPALAGNRKGSLENLDDPSYPVNGLTLSSQRIDLIREELKDELREPQIAEAREDVLIEFEKNLIIAKDLQTSKMWGACINMLKKNLEVLHTFQPGKSIISVEKLNRVLYDYNIELANCYVKIGDFRAAIRHTRGALDLKPRDSRAQYILGSSLIKLEDHSNAYEILREAQLGLQLTTADEYSSLIDAELKKLEDHRISKRESLKLSPKPLERETPAGSIKSKRLPRVYSHWSNVGLSVAAGGSTGALGWFFAKHYTDFSERKGLYMSLGLGVLIGGLTYFMLSHSETPQKGKKVEKKVRKGK